MVGWDSLVAFRVVSVEADVVVRGGGVTSGFPVSYVVGASGWGGEFLTWVSSDPPHVGSVFFVSVVEAEWSSDARRYVPVVEGGSGGGDALREAIDVLEELVVKDPYRLEMVGPDGL